MKYFLSRHIFYIGGRLQDNSRVSTLYTMDLSSKHVWVLQTGKMNPPGLLGQVFSNFVLEESILIIVMFVSRNLPNSSIHFLPLLLSLYKQLN